MFPAILQITKLFQHGFDLPMVCTGSELKIEKIEFLMIRRSIGIDR